MQDHHFHSERSFATQAGISPRTLGRILRGEKVDPEPLQKIADALSVPVENLYRLSVTPSKQFDARRFKVSAEDFELTLEKGSVFTVETDQGVTGLVLLGSGEDYHPIHNPHYDFRDELIATGRTDEQIAREIGADHLIYQDLDALIADVRSVNPKVTSFEDSCFSGNYVTGDVTQAYLEGVEAQRRDGRKRTAFAASQLDLNLETVE